MTIKKIDNCSYLIKNIDIQDIYDYNELNFAIKKIVNKLKKIDKLKNSLYFTIYVNSNNEYIIEVKKNKFYNREIVIEFVINSIFLYKIDYFFINNIDKKKINIFYYKGNFYIQFKKQINKRDKYLLEEYAEEIYRKETKYIVSKGIRIK